jgi:hypothetical protein
MYIAFPANAKTGCPNYQAIKRALDANQHVTLYMTHDYVSAYSEAIGLPMPADSEPQGMMVYDPGASAVSVAIIEADGGVCYTAKVKREPHDRVTNLLRAI